MPGEDSRSEPRQGHARLILLEGPPGQAGNAFNVPPDTLRLSQLPPGMYRAKLVALGYQSAILGFRLAPGGCTMLRGRLREAKYTIIEGFSADARE